MYYGALVAESMCYGIMLIVHAKSGDTRIPSLLRYLLISLSLVSITLNFARAFVLVWILDTDEYETECVEFGYDRDNAYIMLFALVLEWPSCALSISNFRFAVIASDNEAEDRGYDYAWLVRQHGKNLIVVVMLVTWILLANILYKLDFSYATMLWYVVSVCVLYAYCIDCLYERCRRLVANVRNVCASVAEDVVDWFSTDDDELPRLCAEMVPNYSARSDPGSTTTGDPFRE